MMTSLESLTEVVHAVDSVAHIEGSEERLRSLLTITSTDKKRPYTLEMIYPSPYPNCVGIPRALVPGTGPSIEAEWPSIDLESYIKLWPYQQQILQVFDKKLNEHPYGGIIRATTGCGKTYMGIEQIVNYDMPALVIAPTETIFNQWLGRIQKLTSIDSDDIGIIRGKTRKYKGKKVTVAMIHSLSLKDDLPERLFNEFGLVIFDEVHLVGAEMFSRVAPMFNCKLRIGYSATPIRKNGMDAAFLWHIGPRLVSYERNGTKPKIYQISYYNYDDTNQVGCMYGGEFNSGKYVSRLVKSPHRNRLLQTVVKEAVSRGHKVLLLTDRKEHVEVLYQQLNGYRVGVYTGGHKDFSTSDADIPYDIILATYGSAGLGFDMPDVTCLVLATPRTDLRQISGRVARKDVYNIEPLIIDVIDCASPIMEKWAAKRRKFYASTSCEVRKKEVRK